MKLKANDPNYWKDWYWNRGGREKVQHSRKVTQPEKYGKVYKKNG